MKELKDFPGYFVTEDGRVFSAWKLKATGKGNKSYIDYNDPKELKQKTDSGYLRICLRKNTKIFTKLIHRLVAETYINNPDNLPQVNHIDENKTNNHVLNLEWVTQHQNNIHSQCRCIYRIGNIITGEIIETINVREFARNNNLDQSALRRTLTGKQKHHKNHKILSKKQFK
jgi:hypothetical protein